MCDTITDRGGWGGRGCHGVKSPSRVSLEAGGGGRGFHQGAWLTSASSLNFLLSESCQSHQTDKQTDRWRDRLVGMKTGRQAGRQANSPLTQWSRNTRSPVAAMDTVLESLCSSLTLYVYCMHVCMHVRRFILKALSLVTIFIPLCSWKWWLASAHILWFLANYKT